MKCEKEDVLTFIKALNELDIVSSKGTVNETKMCTLSKHIDNLTTFMKEYSKLHKNCPYKLGEPVVHKEHGNVLLSTTSVGFNNNEFTYTEAKVVKADGSTQAVKFSDLMPYSTATKVLFKKD